MQAKGGRKSQWKKNLSRKRRTGRAGFVEAQSRFFKVGKKSLKHLCVPPTPDPRCSQEGAARYSDWGTGYNAKATRV